MKKKDLNSKGYNLKDFIKWNFFPRSNDTKLQQIKEYCELHKQYMWAASILGIINDTDFRGDK